MPSPLTIPWGAGGPTAPRGTRFLKSPGKARNSSRMSGEEGSPGRPAQGCIPALDAVAVRVAAWPIFPPPSSCSSSCSCILFSSPAVLRSSVAGRILSEPSPPPGGRGRASGVPSLLPRLGFAVRGEGRGVKGCHRTRCTRGRSAFSSSGRSYPRVPRPPSPAPYGITRPWTKVGAVPFEAGRKARSVPGSLGRAVESVIRWTGC